MEQPHQTILIYSLFHGKVLPECNLEIIKDIDRDQALRFLIKLKIAVTRMGGRNVNHPFVKAIIFTLPENLGAKLYKLLSSPALGEYLTHPVVVNKLIADILASMPPSQNDQDLPQADFAASMLDIVMLYNEHHFKTLKIGNRPDDHDLIWEMMLMQNVNAVNQSAYARNGIGKQAIFLEFLKLKLGTQFEEYENRLCTAIGIEHLTDVIHHFIQLQVEQDKLADTGNPLMAVLTDNPLYDVFTKLGLVVDASAGVIQDAVDRLYMHPFIKLSDNMLYLTGTNDFGLITDKGWQYTLFKLGKLSDYLPKLQRFDDFQSYVGLNYIEKFLLAKLFLQLHKPGFRVVLSDDQKTSDVTLIQNERDVFIIEIKSYAMHYNVWKNQNIQQLKEHLHEKYISDKTGVVQLHKNLKNLAGDPNGLFRISTPLKKLRIYPVIIYTEPHIGSMAINDYIISQAPALPEEIQNLFQLIMPVTMIHYDFFLENFELMQQKKNILKDAILRYHSDVKARKKTWLKIRSTFNFSRAMVSFDNHAAGYKGIYQSDQLKIFAALRKIFMP